ncbi:MAG: hypothetical protein LBP62_08035 [Clostridiales bacterium]|nr:hypothetical protein [Clostridiales bacterium]
MLLLFYRMPPHPFIPSHGGEYKDNKPLTADRYFLICRPTPLSPPTEGNIRITNR